MTKNPELPASSCASSSVQPIGHKPDNHEGNNNNKNNNNDSISNKQLLDEVFVIPRIIKVEVITLLSVPSKVLCQILLMRSDSAIDSLKLREKQAGFRKGRGCIDQIFALRTISSTKEAFNRLHRGTPWTILRSYGVPPKLVTLIELFNKHFECSVIIDGNLSEWFPVKLSVLQG